MKNKFRVILCLLFAVILPFSFVGCKDKSTNNDDATDVTPSPESNPSPSTPEQEVSYVLDEAEVIRILGESSETCESFILKINENSELLSDNNYSSSMGERTASAFNHVYYPKLIMENLNYRLELKSKTFKLGEVYEYASGSGVYRYIEVNASDNNKIVLDVVSWDLSTLVHYNFEISIDAGEITQFNIAKLVAPSGAKQIEFANTYLDFENDTLSASFGNVNGFYLTNENFFNEYFTADKFSQIPSSYWGYSQFEKMKLSGTSQVTFSKDIGGEEIINDFENFRFLGAFEKYHEYMELTSEEFVAFQDDFFGIIDANSERYRYNSDDFTFDKIV